MDVSTNHRAEAAAKSSQVRVLRLFKHVEENPRQGEQLTQRKYAEVLEDELGFPVPTSMLRTVLTELGIAVGVSRLRRERDLLAEWIVSVFSSSGLSVPEPREAFPGLHPLPPDVEEAIASRKEAIASRKEAISSRNT